MQKYTKNTSWFTLVELIIVITILSILATIGFTSFQWYTADARDTKRTSDLSSLISAIEAKRAGNALSIVSFVNTGTLANVTTASIAWKTVTPWSEYKAWIMDFALLWVSADWFKDPRNVHYSFWATTLKWGQYQFAAALENGEKPQAVVKWNYSARVSQDINVAITSRDYKVLELKNTTDYPKMMIWDTLADWGATVCWIPANTTITSISSDLKYITLSAIPTGSSVTATRTSCNIKLAATEVAWLIWDYSSIWALDGTPVVDGSWATLPY